MSRLRTFLSCPGSLCRVHDQENCPALASALDAEIDRICCYESRTPRVERRFSCAVPGFLPDSVRTRAAVMAWAFLFRNPENWIGAASLPYQIGRKELPPMLEFPPGVPGDKCEPTEAKGSAR